MQTVKEADVMADIDPDGDVEQVVLHFRRPQGAISELGEVGAGPIRLMIGHLSFITRMGFFESFPPLTAARPPTGKRDELTKPVPPTHDPNFASPNSQSPWPEPKKKKGFRSWTSPPRLRKEITRLSDRLPSHQRPL